MTFAYKNHHEMKKARLEVLEKSKGKCAFCNNDALVVHHKDGTTDNHNKDNLVALCVSCHTKMHKTAVRVAWDVDALKYAMMQRGMDKRELAEKIGLLPASMSRIFNQGKTKNSTMRKIAEALNFPLEVFIKEV